MKLVIGSRLHLLLLSAFLAVLYLIGLDFPTRPYYDEVYFVPSARQYLEGQARILDTAHPPLGKLLIAVSIHFFGDHPVAWRLPSVLCGVLLVFVFFQILKRLTKNQTLAFLGAFLLGLDGIHLTQSRIAMLNVSMQLWMFLSLLWLLKWSDEDSSKVSTLWISSFFLGLAAATRWVGLGITPVLALCWLPRFLKEEKKATLFFKTLGIFTVGTLLTYFLVHLVMVFGQGRPVGDIWGYQQHMLSYHAKLTEGHTYGSAWWSWPLMIRPIWFFFERTEVIRGVFTIGNPLLYWPVILTIPFCLFRWAKTKEFIFGLAVLGFLGQWLPWSLIGRVQFFHYFYPVVPFAILALLLFFQYLWSLGKNWQRFILIYAILTIISFFYWYTLYAGLPISEAFFRNHMWFRKWI